MSTETISVSTSGAVATITLDRPDRFNAYTPEMGQELYATLADFDADDGIRAIIITGAGRHFCAGADLGSGGDTFADNRFAAAAKQETRVRPWNMRTPVIAAINGAAVGVGATLPLQWDIRIASDKAKIGFVFTRRGLVPEAHSTWILPRLIGFSRANELLITGRIVTAAEALEYGLVSRVVPAAELLAVANEIAQDIARNTAPVSVAITKRLLWRQLVQSDPRPAKVLEDELFNWAGQRADAAEGVESFLDKREPAWKMSLDEMPDSIGPLDEL
jgi:enoyl-CoA hydratase/carnithine racemase